MCDTDFLTLESADKEKSMSYCAARSDVKQIQHTERGRVSCKLLIAIVTTLLGSAVPAGHNLSVINTPQQTIRDWLRETLLKEHNVVLNTYQDNLLWGFVVSIFVGGAMLGGAAGIIFTDFLGRKRSLLFVHCFNFLSGIIIASCQFVNRVELLLAGRLLAGLMAGASTGLIPLYLCEVAPATMKGVMGTIFPLGITAGVLLAQIFGLQSVLGRPDTWAYLVGGHALYAFVALILHPWLPPSAPITESSSSDAHITYDRHKELCKLQSDSSGSSEEEGELLKLKHVGDMTILQVLRDSSLHRPLLCVIMLNAGQQLSGINAVFFYSTLVFMKAGLGITASQGASLGAGVANLLMAASAVHIIKFCPRKSLLFISISFYLSCQVILAVSLYLTPSQPWAAWLAPAALFFAIVAYGLGLGPVPYMIGTEMFPSASRKVGLSLGGTSNWGANMMVGLLFPLLQESLGILSFGIFIFCCLCLLLFVHLFVPETLRKEPDTS